MFWTLIPNPHWTSTSLHHGTKSTNPQIHMAPVYTLTPEPQPQPQPHGSIAPSLNRSFYTTSLKAEQWSHVVLWFCGSGVKVYIGACGSVVQGSKFKTWWNWDQNMMKLGPKHGEIHILWWTTFCTLTVPYVRYIRYIYELYLKLRYIYFHPMGMLYCCHVTGKLTPRPV